MLEGSGGGYDWRGREKTLLVSCILSQGIRCF